MTAEAERPSAGRSVAIVFSDLEEHMAAWEKLPRDDMVQRLVAYGDLVSELTKKHSAFHTKFTGDGHLCLFDSADVAVSFALQLLEQWPQRFQQRFGEGDPMPLRLGAHQGTVTQIWGSEFVGQAIGIAKRVEGRAEAGSLMVSDTLYDHLDHASYRKGRAKLARLKGDHLPRRRLYPIVGRATPEVMTAEAWFLRALSFVGTSQENSEEEANCYRQALRLRPDLPETHNNYAILLAAMERFLRIIASAGNAFGGFAETGRYEEAEGHYQAALRLRPEYPEAHNNYANLLEYMKRPGEAEGHYQAALRLRPEYPEAHNNYANLLGDLGRPEEAEGHYLEALRLRPEYPQAHYNYANLLKDMKRPAEAEGHYQEVLRLRPDYPEVHYSYSVLLGEMGRREEAEEHFQEAFRHGSSWL